MITNEESKGFLWWKLLQVDVHKMVIANRDMSYVHTNRTISGIDGITRSRMKLDLEPSFLHPPRQTEMSRVQSPEALIV